MIPTKAHTYKLKTDDIKIKLAIMKDVDKIKEIKNGLVKLIVNDYLNEDV